MLYNDSPQPPMGHLLAAVFVFFIVSFSIFTACGFAVQAGGFTIALRTLLFLVGFAYLLRNRPIARKFAWAISGVTGYLLVCFGGLMLSFSAAIACLPLQDAVMYDIDRALGYDWRTYGQFVKDRPLLGSLFRFAYFSIDWQPLIVVAVLAWRSADLRMTSYVISTGMGLIFTAAIFAVLPVTTAWTYGSAADVGDAARLSMVDSWAQELQRLRDGQLREISWGIKGAIIGFPSFHCIAAIINTWHLWRDPLYRLFGMPLNAALIAASLVLGGHYLIDLIAGVPVAIASLAVTQVIIRVFAKPPRCTSGTRPLRRYLPLARHPRVAGSDGSFTSARPSSSA